MTTFFALAALLVIVAAIPLVLPLLRRAPQASGDADQRAANLTILRDQLTELEREHAEGSLSADDFAQARQELQRRLLEEAAPAGDTAREAAPSRKTALMIVILLPLVALAGYGVLGNPQALDPAARQPVQRLTAGDIEAMVGKLAARLAETPDDLKGWLMLGRSYKALGRYAEAVEAYGKALPLIEKDATLLADYAELLAITGNGFRGKASELIEKALTLAPEDPQVLLLAGAAAGERRDFKRAVAYWEKVLPQLEPGSEEAEALSQALSRARAAAEASAGKPGNRGKPQSR